MNKEIEIPYGYEARIEGNKVILEPMEGDDERIRKEIISAILSGRVYDTDLIGAEHIFELDKEVADKWLAYLKPKPKFNVGDTIRLKNSYAEYTIESISDGRYYCKGCSINIDDGNRDYELVRQKPTEWSDKDESYLQTVISEMEANKKEAQVYEHKNYDAIILWLKSLRPQPKQEWGEEDKKNRSPLKTKEIKVGDIITYFKNGKKGIMLVSSFDAGIYPRCKWGITDIDGTAYGDWAPGSGPYYIATEKEKQQLYDTMPIEVKNWLKSLRPVKQEWSEVDEKRCKLIVADMKSLAHRDEGSLWLGHANWLEDRLKSIHPQPHWKPSEEQIMAPNTNRE